MTESTQPTTNPTECPACGSVGEDWEPETEQFTCGDRECGVDTFYRGEVSGSQPSVPNYDRGADNRTVSTVRSDDYA